MRKRRGEGGSDLEDSEGGLYCLLCALQDESQRGREKLREHLDLTAADDERESRGCGRDLCFSERWQRREGGQGERVERREEAEKV